MSAAITLPPDTRLGLSIRHEPDGTPLFFVCLAPAPIEPVPEHLARRGEVGCLLTHDAGCDFPNRAGCMLAEEVVLAGGVAGLVFHTIADALACKQRLELGREGRHHG